MRTSVALPVAACILNAATTNALTLVKREDPRVVQHTIRRRNVENPVERDRARMQRRDTPISVSLTNEETLYWMDASLGTPAQSFKLHLDTGSSDLWVNVPNSTLCEQNSCSNSGTYNSADSSTYAYVNSDFNITYADGAGAAGIYATDILQFDNVKMTQQFGLGEQSSTTQCIVGIGYPSNEAQVEVIGAGTYPNLPQNLMDNGYISTNAYSLWLNDLDANTGSILFGGVNADKYHGDLETLPIVKTYGYYSAFYIAMTAVGANGTVGSIANNIADAALLDSGTSLAYLPNDIVQTIYNDVGAEYDANQGVGIIDCNMMNSDATIDFTFSSPTIRVPLNELVIVAGYRGQNPVCIFGIVPAEGGPTILGDTFLRSAYVVYDITGNTVSIAQTNFNSTSDNIMEITNSSGIPGASTVTSAVTNVVAETGAARISGVTTILDGGAGGSLRASLFGVVAAAVGVGAGLVFAV